MTPLVHAGRYDPRFLGVMIRTAGGLGPASFDAADRGPLLPTDMLEQLSTNPFISDVSRGTVLVHEMRHFHDALLYPFGAAVLAARVFAATNGGVLAAAIARSAPGAAIPIPLEKWLHWSSAQRTEYLSLMSPGLPARVVDLPILDRDPDPPDLPVGQPISLPDTEIVRVGSQLVLNAYRLMDRYWRAPHGLDEKPVASAAALFEVPGVLAQLAAIQLRANEAVMDRFAHWLFTMGPPVYRMGFNALQACLRYETNTYQGRELLGLVAWSQLGRFAAPERTSAPAWRLNRVYEAMRRGLRWRPTDPFLDLIRRWDDAAGSDSIANLHDSTTALVAMTDRYARRAASPSAQMPYQVAAAALRAFLGAHLRMKEAFLKDPDAYVDPVTYVNEVSRYPRPAVAVTFFDEPRPGEPKEDWVDGTPADWTPAIDYTTATELSILVSLSDALFLSERKARQEGARYRVRELFGMEPFVLLGDVHDEGGREW